jgi:glycosyltransferase involved in cell wall biosynthesis
MKLAVVSTQVFQLPISGYSGLEVLAFELAKGFAARGHSTTIMAPDGSECPGCQVIPCGLAGQTNEHQAYDKYWKYLASFDAIVDHSWQKYCYLGKAEGILPNTSVLGVWHAPINTCIGALPPGVDKPNFTCISHDQKAHFDALFCPREAKVAYNGCDTELYKPLNVPRSDRYLFLARFSSIKGADLAIEACLQTGVGLDLVGDTSITNEPDYFNACKARCDGKQVRMVGPCSRGETVWWFSQARALLHMAQRFREPFGLAPVEAQLCGCPVLAFDYGALRETVLDGKTGHLVRGLDEVVGLIRSNAVDRLDRDYCRSWSMKFGLDNFVGGYLALIEEALATGGW